MIMAKVHGILPMRYDPDIPELDENFKGFLRRSWESDPDSRPSSAEAAEFVAAELRRLA